MIISNIGPRETCGLRGVPNITYKESHQKNMSCASTESAVHTSDLPSGSSPPTASDRARPMLEKHGC